MLATEADALWVDKLHNHRVGRGLAAHLRSVREEGATQLSAREEAESFARAFVQLLGDALRAGKPPPCGLPSPLPRFIALLNLSGERMVVCSDHPALLHNVCTPSHGLPCAHELNECLSGLATFPFARTSTSVQFLLVSYSLPWQTKGGVAGTFWRAAACALRAPQWPPVAARTPTRPVPLELHDNILVFSSTMTTVMAGKRAQQPESTAPPPPPPPPVLRGLDLAACVATRLGATPGFAMPATAAPPARDASPDAQKVPLQRLAQRLAADRVRDQAEIRWLRAKQAALERETQALRDEHTNAMKDARDEHGARMATVVSSISDARARVKTEHDALLAEMATLEQQHTASATALQDIKQQRRAAKSAATTLKRQGAAKQALHDATISKHVATIEALERQIAETNERTAATRAAVSEAHDDEMARMRAEYAEAAAAHAATLSGKRRIIDQLSETSEQRAAEAATLQDHVSAQTQTVERLEAERLALERLEAERLALEAAIRDAPKGCSIGIGTTDTPLKDGGAKARMRTTGSQTPRRNRYAAGASEARSVVGETAAPNNQCRTYQGALDVLRELASWAGPMRNGQPPLPQYNGTPRPLPFPHFVPQPMLLAQGMCVPIGSQGAAY